LNETTGRPGERRVARAWRGVADVSVAQVSLLHDELAIARNVPDRTFSDLLAKPLDHSQSPPPSWIAVTVMTRMTSISELGSRTSELYGV
jgi:hypothetical protein